MKRNVASATLELLQLDDSASMPKFNSSLKVTTAETSISFKTTKTDYYVQRLC